MYNEGYLGTSKLLLGLVKDNKMGLTVLDQSSNKTIRSYATSQELRHASEMLKQAADKMDK